MEALAHPFRRSAVGSAHERNERTVENEVATDIESKLTAIQIAMDEFTDTLTAELKCIQSWLEDGEVETAVAFIDSMLSELGAGESE
jgi:hypothetical protein